MSADSQFDVQKAVYDALAAHQDLVELLADGTAGIYDHVPAGAGFPYVVIGEARAGAFDSQGFDGMEQVITLRAFSRYRGMKEIKQIMAAIYDALHDANFAVSNQNLVFILFSNGESRLEGDGLTRQGLMRFRVLTEGIE